jgi:hypothetical protein
MFRESSHRWLTLAACVALAGCNPQANQLRRGDADAPLVVAAPCVPVPLVLTPGDVLRMSLSSNGLGDALESEARGQKNAGCATCRASQKQAKLSAELQGHASDELRNQTATLALTAYFRLAEARVQMSLLLQGVEPIEALVAQVEELRRQGLPVPDDSSKLPQERSKLEADRVRLDLLESRLGEQLHQVVGKAAGLPPCSCSTITTIEVFHVDELAIDEAAAIAVGLKYRPDLNLIRSALCNLDVGTLPVIRHVMLGLSSLLSGPARRCIPIVECVPLLLPGLSAKEVEKVSKQLQALLDERKRQAISDIRQAVRAIHAQQNLIRLARDREAMAQRKLDESEENFRQKRGKTTAVPLARQDLLRARGDVVHEVIEWEIARVNLRKAQGLLVRDGVEKAREVCAAGER